MSKDREDLRATAEDMIDDSQQLERLEREKMRLEPQDPRLAELSRQIEALVAEMATKARAQTKIATDVAEN